MKWTVRTMMGWVAAIAVLMGGLIAVTTSFQGTNCGGNSAALADVHIYSIVVRSGAAESPEHQFSLDTATAEQRRVLARVADDFWIRPSRFLVALLPYQHRPSGPRQVIIVCERPFRNVPRLIWGLAPPTHAAAFSDGSYGLISVAEFEALDRSALVPLDEILAASRVRMSAPGAEANTGQGFPGSGQPGS